MLQFVKKIRQTHGYFRFRLWKHHSWLEFNKQRLLSTTSTIGEHTHSLWLYLLCISLAVPVTRNDCNRSSIQPIVRSHTLSVVIKSARSRRKGLSGILISLIEERNGRTRWSRIFWTGPINQGKECFFARYKSVSTAISRWTKARWPVKVAKRKKVLLWHLNVDWINERFDLSVGHRGFHANYPQCGDFSGFSLRFLDNFVGRSIDRASSPRVIWCVSPVQFLLM